MTADDAASTGLEQELVDQLRARVQEHHQQRRLDYEERLGLRRLISKSVRATARPEKWLTSHEKGGDDG